MLKFNKETWHNCTDFLRSSLFSKRNYIRAGIGVAKSITNFATNKSPLSFIEGGFSLLDNISQLGNTTSQEFFAQERGWKELINSHWKHKSMFDIFNSVLESFPHTVINYGYTALTPDNTDKIYDTPIGHIGKCKNQLFFKTKTQTKQKIWDWLLDQKIKQLNSKFYSLVSTKVNTGQYAWENSTNFELCADEMFPIHSVNSEYYTKYLKAYIDKDINRSVIFLGPPGTGKSTLIQTVLQNLQLTSFRFKYDPLTTNLNSIQYLLKALKVEALIMDDFDQGRNEQFLLEFLEWANRNIKLILASSNSLKTVHPAFVRPGRFAEVITIDKIDHELLQTLLQDKYNDLKNMVESWPVAYINELMVRLSVHPDSNREILVDELNTRVNKALELLK